MLRSLCLLLIGIFWTAGLLAQPKTAARYEQAYREGMALYDKGQYKEAVARLSQAQADVPENVFAAQARCMTGAAYLKAGQPDNAIATLTTLQAKYPNWSGHERSALLILEAQLKAKRWRKAIQQLHQAGGLRGEAQAAAYAGLAACPPDSLLALDRAFPLTAPLEARLAEAGKAANASPEVKARARQMVESGRITYLNFQSEEPKTDEPGEVEVALLLPLKANPQNPGNGRNPLAEMIAGARLAQEDLSKQGISIGLHLYDTHRNADTLTRLLTLPELKQCRLIIGPVTTGIAEAAEFAAFNNMAMVVPLTNQIRWQEGNTAAYLSEPSIDGMVTAVLAQSPGAEKAGIIYGNATSDSILAFTFRREAQKAGLEVPLFKRVAKNSASNLSKFISEADIDSVSILFIPNKESLVRVQLAQALEVSKSKARVVTYGDILEDTEVPFTTWERLGVRFLYPGYIPGLPRGEGSVTERLTAALGVPPTDAAYKGYDLVYSLAPLMRAGKPAEALRLNSPIRGQFGLQFDFTSGQANSDVPLYRMERGQLVRE